LADDREAEANLAAGFHGHSTHMRQQAAGSSNRKHLKNTNQPREPHSQLGMTKVRYRDLEMKGEMMKLSASKATKQ